ncbi:T9SS type A sorting domain-containing protein [Parabacteroides sp.]
MIEGGAAQKIEHKAALHTDNVKSSLFWYDTFFENKEKGQSTATGASTIEYLMQGTEEDIIICDISLNKDYTENGTTLIEPTLSKRYKFIIKPATEIADRIDAAKGNGIESYEITSPSKATNINIQMKTLPSNYCWYDNKKTIREGYQFCYSKGDNTGNIDLTPKKQVITFPSVLKQEIIKVYAKSSNGNLSPLLATFTITPQADSEFMLEENVDRSTSSRRHPDDHSNLYEFITSADFDQGGLIASTALAKENNLCTTPMGPEASNYAFLDQQKIRGDQLTPLQNQYGLFRSANVKGKEGVSTNDVTMVNKKYVWFFPLQDNTNAPEVYDRTYARTNKQQCGYFYYIDASNEPGRLVKIELEEEVCQYTELLVTAWVNDMTTWGDVPSNGGKPLPPNININFIGQNKGGNPVVLHRFTSGDALTDYSGIYKTENDANVNVGKWQQVCYTLAINSTESKYDHYYIEVQNNTIHTYGADYAIDDVRVYKSKPNISVRRKNACTSSTLVVSSDYGTLMRNMGWNIQPDVLVGVDLTKKGFRKYRYGLMGADPYADDPHGHVGNVYYGATDQLETATGAEAEDWVIMNKELAESSDPILQSLSRTIRIAVPTAMYEEGHENIELIPNNYEDAFSNEIIMNIRAINDFISDAGKKTIDDIKDQRIWTEDELEAAEIDIKELLNQLTGEDNLNVEIAAPNTEEGHTTGTIINVPNETIRDIKIKGSPRNQIYEALLLKVYSFLQIPRIHCPWKKAVGGQEIIYLGSIDVENTDLKFKGEKIPNTDQEATGEYEVILFSAREIAEATVSDPDPNAPISVVDFTNPCLLHSPFIVQPSYTIAVNTDMAHDGTACLGAIATVDAELWVEKLDGHSNPTGTMEKYSKVYPDGLYTFDWYVGKDVAQVDMKNLQTIIQEFRDTRKGKETARFSKDDILKNEDYYKNNQNDADYLISLLSGPNPQLIVGDGKKPTSILWTDLIVALPYVPVITGAEKEYIFCTEPQTRKLEAFDSPALSVGFPGVVYPITKVPLRMGLTNITGDKTLNKIPIQNNIDEEEVKIIFGSGGDRLGMPYNNSNLEEKINEVYLYDEINQDYIVVADLVDDKGLSATAEDGGYLSLTFRDKIAETFKFKEGETYSLYIPFGEYKGDTKILNSCGGYAELQIKIVAEYLTWNGGENEKWYNDGNLWTMSTKQELYGKDGISNEDRTATFSPLYFSKITLLKNGQLSLSPEKHTDKVLEGVENVIKYDMAVNNTGANKTIEVVPYYGNKVEQIYFKPNATLTNQYLLDYQKAWVEFEIENKGKRWMASPLQNVYAGDFYAPKGNGRQETPAFTDITYEENKDADIYYSRWAPAFYQKAWNHAIQYANNEAGTEITNVTAVKNNWSIEYNDVTVPYPIGKGFYLSVEDVLNNDGIAMVRLPKADDNYQYEIKPTTKAGEALTDTPRDATAGKLAAFDGDGKLSLTLDESVYHDEDAKYYLIGNPAMADLNMNSFFEKNKNLSGKYWTLQNGTFSATVDEKFTDANDADAAGTIAPMEAFFVEVKGGDATKTETTIQFTSDMFTHKSGTATKASSFSASYPMISLIAERSDRKSVAKLTTRDNADNGYREAEDAIALIDTELDMPIVYTVASSKAAQVNAVKSIRNIGLGVYNDKNDEVTLTIEGLSRLPETLYLYDAHTRKSVKLEGDSYSLQVSGDSHGRYFLRDSELGTELENTISIYSAQRGKVIVSSLRPVKDIKVVGLDGSQVRQFSVNTTQYTFNLPAGIYMIYASDGEREHTEKVIVR